MDATPEDIVSALDECPMSPKVRSEVAYRILGETNRRDELVDIILDQYRDGFKNEDVLEDLIDRLSYRRVHPCEGSDDFLLHIAWGLFPEEGDLDGYLAEYYYLWAGNLGIPEEKVSNIFLQFRARDS